MEFSMAFKQKTLLLKLSKWSNNLLINRQLSYFAPWRRQRQFLLKHIKQLSSIRKFLYAKKLLSINQLNNYSAKNECFRVNFMI